MRSSSVAFHFLSETFVVFDGFCLRPRQRVQVEPVASHFGPEPENRDWQRVAQVVRDEVRTAVLAPVWQVPAMNRERVGEVEGFDDDRHGNPRCTTGALTCRSHAWTAGGRLLY